MRQKGMALLTVLLLLAVMVALAALATERWFFSFQYGVQLHQRAQGKWFAAGAEDVAGGLLRLDALDDMRHTHLSQRWATLANSLPLESGQLQMRINDAQACFNLNALGDDGARTVFIRLLTLNGVETATAQMIAVAAADWVTEGDESRAGGVKDSEYAALEPPYLTAQQLMWDVSELRQVRGVSADLWNQLRTQLCALPVQSLALNINTLGAEHWPLVAALSDDITEEDVRRWIAQRPDAGWPTLEAAFAGLKPLAGQRRYLALNSEFFSVHISASMDDVAYRQHSLLQRSNGKISVLWRQQEAEP
ncbi:type II secretion system minor pseudopilin GspK [Enterobacteriaceae bacterium 4M9]|nr:type II secretion system minor pseudopilin GspK [Enterobacteriaceae bacterium 4M9]